jgi:hypothetical protein
VHLPDFGDFQMSQIDGTPDPHPFSTRVPKDGKKGEGMETEEGEGAQRRETLEILDMADPDKQVLLTPTSLSQQQPQQPQPFMLLPRDWARTAHLATTTPASVNPPPTTANAQC